MGSFLSLRPLWKTDHTASKFVSLYYLSEIFSRFVRITKKSIEVKIFYSQNLLQSRLNQNLQELLTCELETPSSLHFQSLDSLQNHLPIKLYIVFIKIQYLNSQLCYCFRDFFHPTFWGKEIQNTDIFKSEIFAFTKASK